MVWTLGRLECARPEFIVLLFFSLPCLADHRQKWQQYRLTPTLLNAIWSYSVGSYSTVECRATPGKRRALFQNLVRSAAQCKQPKGREDKIGEVH